MRRLRQYSSRQKLSCSAWRPALPRSYRILMSPPAQKALPPAPVTMTRVTTGSRSHRSSALAISRTIFNVSAFSTLGRLSVRRPQRPAFSHVISGSLMPLKRHREADRPENNHHAQPRCLHDFWIDLFCSSALANELEIRHFPGENEIAGIEPERARNTIFVEVERQSIARRVVLFAGFEIADGDRPAPHVIEFWDMHRLFQGGIGDRAADVGCRFIDLFAGFRPVIDLDLEQVLARFRRRQNAFQMLGWKNHIWIELELIVFRCGEVYR